MKISHHVAVSAMVSSIIYGMFKSWGLTIASFISGIFIDLDHFIDYLILEGVHFNVNDFFNFIYEERNNKIIFIFHGWEWSIVLVTAAWTTDWNPWVTGVLIGYGHHMFLDAFFNTNWPLLGYSFLWRWKKNFIAEMIRPRKSEINKN
jgi:hypothetical protein